MAALTNVFIFFNRSQQRALLAGIKCAAAALDDLPRRPVAHADGELQRRAARGGGEEAAHKGVARAIDVHDALHRVHGHGGGDGAAHGGHCQ